MDELEKRLEIFLDNFVENRVLGAMALEGVPAKRDCKLHHEPLCKLGTALEMQLFGHWFRKARFVVRGDLRRTASLL
jgi:hypothetical protein